MNLYYKEFHPGTYYPYIYHFIDRLGIIEKYTTGDTIHWFYIVILNGISRPIELDEYFESRYNSVFMNVHSDYYISMMN